MERFRNANSAVSKDAKTKLTEEECAIDIVVMLYMTHLQLYSMDQRFPRLLLHFLTTSQAQPVIKFQQM